MTLLQYAVFVGVGAFATTFAQTQTLGRLPITFLLKNHLHLGKEAVAVFFLWAPFAWNLKPLAGIFTDAFPLLGTRRRSYMILGALLAGVLWMVMGLFPNDYGKLLLAAVAMNVFMVLCSTVMGGMMVEAGQAFGAPGRISSLRQVVMSIAGIGSPALGGYFAGKAFGWSATTMVAASTMLALAVITLVWQKEKRVTRSAVAEVAERPNLTVPVGAWIGLVAGAILATFLWKNKDTESVGTALYAMLSVFVLIIAFTQVPTRNSILVGAQIQLSQILRSRTLWMAATMLALIYTVPGLGTALTYRQADELKFSTQFIGNLGVIENITGLGAAFLYAFWCRKSNLRWLIIIGVGVNALFTLLYLSYTRPGAPFIHGIGGFTAVLTELALMDLAVRSTPKGCEALGFSLMMSVRNFGIGISDVLGTKLIDTYHVKFNSLVWVNAGTTAAVLLFVFFLPRLVIDRKEGKGEAPAAVTGPAESPPDV